VVRQEPGGVRVLVAEPNHEADERRLRRFLREALRARTMEITRA